MAEYKLSELYKQTKPFMEENGKRRKPVQDLRVQTLLAQEAAKRQCQGLNADPQAYAGMQQQQQQQQKQQQQQNVQQPTEYAEQQDSRQPDTDFRGFFQQLNQQRQQQPGCQQQQQEQQHLGDGSSRCPEQQQQQQHGMFLDQLLSQHSLTHAPAPKGQLQNLMSIDRTFPPDASRDGFIRDTHAAAGSAGPAAAAAGGGLERFHLHHLELLPWDWSVKSRVRLSSAAPFAVLEEQRGAGLEAACRALAAGAQCREAPTLSNQERLSQVLLQYQYPPSPLGANLMAALRSVDTKEGPASLSTRVAAWRDALRSAYIALRHGHCPVLYVMGQAFRQPFTVVFCSPGVMGCSQLHALLGRSNKALRQHLAGFGVEGVLAGAMEQQAGRQPLPAAAFDGQPGSQLLVSGALQVHSLYAALLALPWCGADQPDVPLLAAPVQFMHAQLCPLRLEVLPDAVLEQQQRPGDAAAAVPQPLHYAELSGSPGIMPWTLHRLMSLMQDTQAQPGFDVYLETEPSSSSLNLLPDTWQQARRAAAEAGEAAAGAAGAAAGLASRQVWQDEGWGLSGAEEAGWQVSRSLLQGRVLRQLRMKNGEVGARLA